jgi:hypothetical protein
MLFGIAPSVSVARDTAVGNELMSLYPLAPY